MIPEILDAQRRQWQRMFSALPDFFGTKPSEPARKAAEIFTREAIKKVLELGCGQGRDTFSFAQNNFQVHALDYSARGLERINKKALEMGVSQRITTQLYDVRNPLPFGNEMFDGAYSHGCSESNFIRIRGMTIKHHVYRRSIKI